MKVAVVHDWLTGMRGGEVVLESILELYPGAELYTLLYNRGTITGLIQRHKIHTSFIDRLPGKSRHYRWYLPLFPTAIELFDFHGYDLVISSSHCVARGVIVPPGVPHISYLHSPMRYVWDMYHEYFPRRGVANRFIIPFMANYLRLWDSAAAPRVDSYLCNSAFVAARIRRYYGREATVVHPPCLRSDEVSWSRDREEFYLIVSAFVPYKRLDLAIRAFARLDRKLIVAGNGPEEANLRRIAGRNVEFVTGLRHDQIDELYRQARGLIFPGVEDFGIVPVEAQARGCPVIAFGRGGALESVVDRRTGLFFYEQSEDALLEAIASFESLDFKKRDFEKSVARFTREQFHKKIRSAVDALMP